MIRANRFARIALRIARATKVQKVRAKKVRVHFSLPNVEGLKMCEFLAIKIATERPLLEPEVLQSRFGVDILFWPGEYLGKLPANLSANFDDEIFTRIFQPCNFQGLRPPQKIHAQNRRHSSPISRSRTQHLFTSIFSLLGRPTISDFSSRTWRNLPPIWVIHMAIRRPAHNTPIHMDFFHGVLLKRLRKAPGPCGSACRAAPCGSPMWGANFAMSCWKSHWNNFSAINYGQNWFPLGERLRGNRTRGNRPERFWEGNLPPRGSLRGPLLSEVFRGFQRFSEVFRGFQRFSEALEASQRPSQSAIFLSELRVLLSLIALPLKTLATQRGMPCDTQVCGEKSLANGDVRFRCTQVGRDEVLKPKVERWRSWWRSRIRKRRRRRGESSSVLYTHIIQKTFL